MEGKKTDTTKNAFELGDIVASLVHRGNYLSAACVLDNTPKGVSTEALYALLAVACSAEYDARRSGSGYGGMPSDGYASKSEEGPQEPRPVQFSERTVDLVDGLINYFKNKSGNYFGKSEYT